LQSIHTSSLLGKPKLHRPGIAMGLQRLDASSVMFSTPTSMGPAPCTSVIHYIQPANVCSVYFLIILLA
jgi:hypothetical protein